MRHHARDLQSSINLSLFRPEERRRILHTGFRGERKRGWHTRSAELSQRYLPSTERGRKTLMAGIEELGRNGGYGSC